MHVDVMHVDVDVCPAIVAPAPVADAAAAAEGVADAAVAAEGVCHSTLSPCICPTAAQIHAFFTCGRQLTMSISMYQNSEHKLLKQLLRHIFSEPLF